MSFEIRTRYIGPVGLKGARFVARGAGRQASAPYDYAVGNPFTHEAQHRAVAERLAGGPVVLLRESHGGRVYAPRHAPYGADDRCLGCKAHVAEPHGPGCPLDTEGYGA